MSSHMQKLGREKGRFYSLYSERMTCSFHVHLLSVSQMIELGEHSFPWQSEGPLLPWLTSVHSPAFCPCG